MFHCRVRQPSLDQSRGGKGVDATLFLNALKVFANNLLPVLPAQFLMQTMSKPSTRVMRNSEPQTGDVKIGLLSCFYHFFHYGISPIIIYYLSIFYHLWIDSSNVVVLLILPFAFVQL